MGKVYLDVSVPLNTISQYNNYRDGISYSSRTGSSYGSSYYDYNGSNGHSSHIVFDSFVDHDYTIHYFTNIVKSNDVSLGYDNVYNKYLLAESTITSNGTYDIVNYKPYIYTQSSKNYYYNYVGYKKVTVNIQPEIDIRYLQMDVFFTNGNEITSYLNLSNINVQNFTCPSSSNYQYTYYTYTIGSNNYYYIIFYYYVYNDYFFYGFLRSTNGTITVGVKQDEYKVRYLIFASMSSTGNPVLSFRNHRIIDINGNIQFRDYNNDYGYSIISQGINNNYIKVKGVNVTQI